MTVWVALLRGVNVGGKNKLPMADFRSLLRGLGYDDVVSYIQSGNAVFRASEDPQIISRSISQAIEDKFGFLPNTIVFRKAELQTAIAKNPFQGEKDGAKVHFFFLDGDLSENDLEPLLPFARDEEKIALNDRVLYLHTPNGFGRSALAEKISRKLPVPATARNARSVAAIAALTEKV